ncbi:hypothetical protein L226DRAFT_616084 [Lentinus tigrinus ALCF2SS1-7]|uniref:Uncharacterized protein n=1 Tax=Lentinus tigrinus ALCF2SS1-6 TaxID=1328759 RepID=A0A5C2RTH2_9APHY|nr:hypothetical protein L227DRAFT_616624 [Lentinus tigrinus ALCF2SS1-6]RPD70574.1 hypothetical protein L226DRAFT_616084 [Lentinus tigrinus ALCF2SS1-7]
MTRMQIVTLALSALAIDNVSLDFDFTAGRALVVDRHSDALSSNAALVTGTRLATAESVGTISSFFEPGPFSAGIFIASANATSNNPDGHISRSEAAIASHDPTMSAGDGSASSKDTDATTSSAS